MTTKNKIYKILKDQDIITSTLLDATHAQRDFVYDFYIANLHHKEIEKGLSLKEKEAISASFFVQNKTDATFAVGDVVFLSWSDFAKAAKVGQAKKSLADVTNYITDILTSPNPQKNIRDIFKNLPEVDLKTIDEEVAKRQGQKDKRLSYLLKEESFEKKTEDDYLIQLFSEKKRSQLIEIVLKGKDVSENDAKEFASFLGEGRHTPLQFVFSNTITAATRSGTITQAHKLSFAQKIALFAWVTDKTLDQVVDALSGSNALIGFDKNIKSFNATFLETNGLAPSLVYLDGYKKSIFRDKETLRLIESVLTTEDIENGKGLSKTLSVFPQKSIEFINDNLPEIEGVLDAVSSSLEQTDVTPDHQKIPKETRDVVLLKSSSVAEEKIWEGALKIAVSTKFSKEENYVEFFQKTVYPPAINGFVDANQIPRTRRLAEAFCAASQVEGYEEFMENILNAVKENEPEEYYKILHKGVGSPHPTVAQFFRTQKANTEKSVLSSALGLLADPNEDVVPTYAKKRQSKM